MKLKELVEKYGEQEVLCWAERADESLEWVNIKLEPPQPKSVWELKNGDWYYCINVKGEVMSDVWREVVYPEREVGNAFLTEKDALKDIERRKVETLLLKHGGRRWFKDGKENWYVTFDRSVGFFRYVYTIRDQRQGTIYFDTEKQARKAVAEIGEDRLKKALFEVR